MTQQRSAHLFTRWYLQLTHTSPSQSASTEPATSGAPSFLKTPKISVLLQKPRLPSRRWETEKIAYQWSRFDHWLPTNPANDRHVHTRRDMTRHSLFYENLKEVFPTQAITTNKPQDNITEIHSHSMWSTTTWDGARIFYAEKAYKPIIALRQSHNICNVPHRTVSALAATKKMSRF